MTRAGVDPQLITNYVQTSGMASPIGTQDVIYLSQQGVATPVIQAMQTPVAPQVAAAAPPVVVVEELHPIGPPVYYRPRHCAPRVGFGVTIHR